MEAVGLLHEFESCRRLIVINGSIPRGVFFQHGTEPTAMQTIIGLDLGKYNSAACVWPPADVRLPSRLAGEGPGMRGKHDSGKRRGQRHVHGGRATVRQTLYMATLTARTWNPVIRAFAERLEAGGKPFKVVMTACMRKLLVILNTIIRTGQPWRETCPENTPPSDPKIALQSS